MGGELLTYSNQSQASTTTNTQKPYHIDPYSSSSSSSMKVYMDRNETKRTTAALHSIRKPPVKPWKKPVAPPPPRLYTVDSSNFKEVVQKLTGQSSEFQSRRLQSVAPPPLNLTMSPPSSYTDLSAPPQPLQSPEKLPSGVQSDFPFETLVEEPMKLFDTSPISTSLALMSPSWWYPWCSFPLLSPGTLASLDQSIVL